MSIQDDIKKLRELAETGEGVYEERLIIDVCDALEKATEALKEEAIICDGPARTLLDEWGIE